VTEIAVRAQQLYEEEGRPEGRSLEHWTRAEQDVHEMHPHGMAPAMMSDEPASEADRWTEEVMHLDQ